MYVGKVFCEIARAIIGEEFYFTAKEDFCDVTPMSCQLSLMISSSRAYLSSDSLLQFLLVYQSRIPLKYRNIEIGRN